MADLAAFVGTLAAASGERAAVLAGPLHVPGSGRVPARLPLFLGKATRTLRAR